MCVPKIKFVISVTVCIPRWRKLLLGNYFQWRLTFSTLALELGTVLRTVVFEHNVFALRIFLKLQIAWERFESVFIVWCDEVTLCSLHSRTDSETWFMNHMDNHFLTFHVEGILMHIVFAAPPPLSSFSHHMEHWVLRKFLKHYLP